MRTKIKSSRDMEKKENTKIEERKRYWKEKERKELQITKVLCSGLRNDTIQEAMVGLWVTVQDPLAEQVDLRRQLSSILYWASSINVTDSYIKWSTFFYLFPQSRTQSLFLRITFNQLWDWKCLHQISEESIQWVHFEGTLKTATSIVPLKNTQTETRPFWFKEYLKAEREK